MFSEVLFSLTLAPTKRHEMAFSLKTSFCGSMTTSAVSFFWIFMVLLLVKCRQCCLKFSHVLLKFLKDWRDLPLREPSVNMLRAFDIPSLNGEPHRPLTPAAPPFPFATPRQQI